MAVTEWKFPGTVINTDVGKNDWLNVDNAKTDDDTFADCTPAKNDFGDRLRCYTFGFDTDDIPTGGSVINGIEVEINRKASVANRINDYYLRLFDHVGSAKGDDYADTVTKWPTTAAGEVAVYGGAADMWNYGWNGSIIRSELFGIGLQCYCDGIAATGYVDYIKIRVYYTPPAPVVIMNQFQKNNLGADLFNGSLI